MDEVMIVDGYNVINAWPELAALKDNLEYAREKLVTMLSGYTAFKGYKTVVVFDAHGTAADTAVESVTDNLDVVYTKEGETADSYIERFSYQLVRQGTRVYVVTSDWAEQLVVLGAGACRISARELRADLFQAEQAIKDGFAQNALTYKRQELGSRLRHDVAQRLDRLRRR